LATRVAFQGEHGAYSEQAALAYFREETSTIPCRTIREVFDLVEENNAQHGIVPAENSLEGTVNQTYDLLLNSPLRIGGETKLRIVHSLLALPGTKLEDVQTVYSHPQALAQCADFLRTLKAEAVPAYDTAGSAKMIQEKKLQTAGAIASEGAGQLYGLTVLKRSVEDNPENFTRFFIIGHEDSPPTGHDKTSVVFGTAHTPGSLYQALGEFAARKINMTKLESRPVRTTPWEYHFFVDLEGHRTDQPCRDALEAVKAKTTFMKVLGSYQRAK
jgi:chorismate mutase/prephenate dehydratase